MIWNRLHLPSAIDYRAECYRRRWNGILLGLHSTFNVSPMWLNLIINFLIIFIGIMFWQGGGKKRLKSQI
jgi:hypothetical protein